MTRQVTEEDFRMPEFRGAKVDDYEFRSDGKIVRKDRWETAVHAIRRLVGVSGREFEISDVVEAVRELVGDRHEWIDLTGPRAEDPPTVESAGDIELNNGSVLCGAVYTCDPGDPAKMCWFWNGMGVLVSDVRAYRPCRNSED